MMQRRALFPLATGALALPFIARPGRAQKSTVLKLAFADTQAHPVYDVLQRFAANVREQTNGAADLHVFSIGQLGSGTNIMTGLQTGIIDFCAHTSGFIDTTFPQFQVVDLPFLFSSEAAAEHMLDGPTGQQLLAMMPAKGIYGLGYGHWGWRVVSTIGRQVPTPPDIRGLKIRVQPGAIFSATFQALGAIPTAIDLTEVYLALSQKAVDAVETPIISVAATKQDEVITTVNATNHVYNAGVLMASKFKFDRLPAAVQAAIRSCVSRPDCRLAQDHRDQDAGGFGPVRRKEHPHRHGRPRRATKPPRAPSISSSSQSSVPSCTTPVMGEAAHG